MNRQFFIGVLFLIVQVFSIFYARFVSERFFCWAPYDQHTYYKVFVEVDGHQLTKGEVYQRYHYKSVGWEPRSINNVFSIIDQYEVTYGKNDKAKVYVQYSINGHKEEIWYLKD